MHNHDQPKPKITEENLMEMREAFNIYDKNGNGYISPKELGLLMRSLGKNPSEDELLVMINEVDFDENQQVDFVEFVQIMLQQPDDSDHFFEEMIKEIIRTYDIENEGYIDGGMLRRILVTYNEMGHEEINQMMRTLDPNSDAKIEYQEIADFFKPD